jgi:hypothetical protein
MPSLGVMMASNTEGIPSRFANGGLKPPAYCRARSGAAEDLASPRDQTRRLEH